MVIHFLEIDINYIYILIYAYTSILKSYLFSIMEADLVWPNIKQEKFLKNIYLIIKVW